MSFYSNLKSHPNQNLESHLLNVANFSKNIFNQLDIKNKNLYIDLSFFIGLCHDFAKSTSYFQEKLLNGVETNKANHSFLSAVFTYYVINFFLKNNNIKNNNSNLPAVLFLAVLKHHGNLSNIEGSNGLLNKLRKNNRIAVKQIDDLKFNLNNTNFSLKNFYSDYNISLDVFIKNYDDIFNDLKYDLEELTYEEDIGYYLILILFYSVLLDADKMDASKTNLFPRVNFSENMVDLFKEKKFNKSVDINDIREEAYHEVINNISNIDLNNKIYSIQLPTGTGKTLTSFSFALKLRQKIKDDLGFSPRIIYSLPFLSIIDQNTNVFEEVLNLYNLNGSNILLKHNYLADMDYKVKDEKDIEIDNAKILIEGWNSEIIVTTFIQFFYSLLTNKNRNLRKFHNIVNSIIILDEIQTIPYHYWMIINIMLRKLAKEFNSWIILMTATQPLIFSSNEIISLIDDKSHYYNSLDRVVYKFKLDKILIDDFCIKLMKDINNNLEKDFLIVLNTINSSKIVYEYIKEYYLNNDFNIEVDEENGVIYIEDDIELIYLSSNVIPYHRLNRINQIKQHNKRFIIVSTQLIEAGVDISADIIYRDFAPIDSIIQSAGRCNRNATKDKGIVNIVCLMNDNGRLFSSYVYDSILLNATYDVIGEINEISEKDFNLKASNDYYNYLKEYGSAKDSKKLINIIEELNFDDIPSSFKLINNNIEKIDVFININEESFIIWEQFKEINDIKKHFERKNEFLKIKPKFYSYIVSVNIKNLGTANIEKDWLGYIDFEDISRKYDIETGFISHENEDVFFI